jgi:hypothetical protein
MGTLRSDVPWRTLTLPGCRTCRATSAQLAGRDLLECHPNAEPQCADCVWIVHVLRDVQYAIDCGDTVLTPKHCDHLRWATLIGKRRSSLEDSTQPLMPPKPTLVLML